MKKQLSMFCIITLCLGISSACASGRASTQADVNIAALRGPSSIGMIKFMDEADSGKITTNDFSFEIFATSDEIVPRIIQDRVDIAAIPANLASILYNNTQGDIQVLAIGTLGMMYIVENGNTINSIEDLRGRTIYAGFKGKSPEFDLNYILNGNNIDPENDLTIEWKSEHTESATALTTRDNTIAVLPQPFVTVTQIANENIRIALDLNYEWNKLQETSENPSLLITGVVVARREFARDNPEAVVDFLNRYAASVEYVNSNVHEAAMLVSNYDIFPAAVAQTAIPYCNITFIPGQEMKEKLSGYLSVLFEQNPQSVGGALPSDDFYFIQ